MYRRCVLVSHTLCISLDISNGLDDREIRVGRVRGSMRKKGMGSESFPSGSQKKKQHNVHGKTLSADDGYLELQLARKRNELRLKLRSHSPKHGATFSRSTTASFVYLIRELVINGIQIPFPFIVAERVCVAVRARLC